MRFSSNYSSVPTVTSKGAETKRDLSCIMIFVLNIQSRYLMRFKISRKNRIFYITKQNIFIFVITMHKRIFQDILILMELIHSDTFSIQDFEISTSDHILCHIKQIKFRKRTSFCQN